MFIDLLTIYIVPPNYVHFLMYNDYQDMKAHSGFFYTCAIHDVCSLILTKPHTNQIYGSDLENEHLRPIYLILQFLNHHLGSLHYPRLLVLTWATYDLCFHVFFYILACPSFTPTICFLFIFIFSFPILSFTLLVFSPP